MVIWAKSADFEDGGVIEFQVGFFLNIKRISLTSCSIAFMIILVFSPAKAGEFLKQHRSG
jgi:hypothetical protein